jgi:hypothetical protein
MGLQLRCHRLQSDAAAEAVGGVGMSAPPNSTAAGGSSRPTFAAFFFNGLLVVIPILRNEWKANPAWQNTVRDIA